MSKRKKTNRKVNKQQPKNKKTVPEITNKKPFDIDFTALILGITGAVILYVLSDYFTPKQSLLLKYKIEDTLFSFLKLFFSVGLVVISFFYKNKTAKIISKYIFLVLILFLLITSVITKMEFSEAFYLENPYIYFLREFLVAPATLFGILNIFIFKDALNKQIDKDFAEQPINEIPENGNFIIKFIKREGIIY